MFIVEIFSCFFLAVIAEESDSVPGTRLAISENCSRCTFSSTSSLIPVRKSKVIMTNARPQPRLLKKGSILRFLGWNQPCAALQAAGLDGIIGPYYDFGWVHFGLGCKLEHNPWYPIQAMVQNQDITNYPPIRMLCKTGHNPY